MTMNDIKSETTPQRIEFDSDRGSSRSFWVALALTLLIVAWMGSGILFPSVDNSPTQARGEPLPIAVSVAPSEAKPVTQFFQAEGQALPDRDTALRAETSGEIADVLVSKGVLAQLLILIQLNLLILQISNSIDSDKIRYRAGAIKTLGLLPGQAFVFELLLQIAEGEVQSQANSGNGLASLQLITARF